MTHMSDESLDFLTTRLGHREYSERRKAEDALVVRGLEAVTPLITVVEQHNLIASVRAASALSRLGDARGVLPVARLLLRESPPISYVFELLGKWQSLPTAEEPREVIRLAQDFKTTGSEAAWAKMFRRVAALSPGWVAPAVPAPRAGGSGTPEDIPGLIQTLRSSNHALRATATAKLIAWGDEAVPALLEALGTDSTLVRYRAVEALGHIGDARAVEPLLALRKIYDPDILQASHAAILVLANHLAEHPSPSEIPQLIALIRQLRLDDQLQAAAISAAQALETLARTHPTPALRGALKLVKPSFWTPLPAEFKEAYQAIEEATKQWKDLPLIADAPQAIENLPLPANESDSRDSHD